MYDYKEAIYLAAKEYVRARAKNNVDYTEETSNQKALAYQKLHWMIDAEKYGWNPEDYNDEC